MLDGIPKVNGAASSITLGSTPFKIVRAAVRAVVAPYSWPSYCRKEYNMISGYTPMTIVSSTTTSLAPKNSSEEGFEG